VPPAHDLDDLSDPESVPAVRSRSIAILRSPWAPALVFSLLCLFVGFGLELALGQHSWYSPRDVWTSFRGGQYLIWGDYAAALHYVSAPGTAILLAPPAFVAYHLGLVGAFPFPLLHPPAWEVLCPYMAVIGATIVPAADSLARVLGTPERHRIALNWAIVCFAVPVIALWGHPEDVVALAIAMQGAKLAIEGKWHGAGWLFGFAVTIQPLVLLVLFPVMALGAPRRWPGIVVRSAVPTLTVMAIPVLTTGGDVLRFMQEPNYIVPNFPTPFVWLGPSAGHNLISAAPERALAVLVAVLIGYLAWRRQVTPVGAIWCAALAMGARVVLEPVLTPYYLWPMAALALVVIAATNRWWATAPLAAVSSLAYFHREPWLYWIPIVLLVAVVTVGTAPAALRRSARVATQPEPEPARRGSPGIATGHG
jgi:hypothetical protein